jgi:SAM-dependent methyltransferase
MADERYHFGDGGTVYDANGAAEHLLRYHAVRDLCAGKRVLDVACGEGYGSYLLATWGASRVVGIDVAADAIEAAQRMFAHQNVTYLRADACRLADALAENETFDLIVSFETIEHVGDIDGLLRGMAARRAPGATIVISCPNDHAERGENPYHLRAFTLTEFQEITSAILGPASEWRLGTPVTGEILQSLAAPAFERAASRQDDLMMRWIDLPHAVMIPPQPETAPTPATCRFYLGTWGEPCGRWTAVAPISYTALVGPWLEAQYLKREILDISRSLPVADGQESPSTELRARIALQASQHEAEAAGLRAAIEAGEALHGELIDRVQASAARIDELLAEIAGMRSDAAEMRTAAEAHTAHRRELEEYIAELRRSVLIQIRERRATNAGLEHVRAELSGCREEYSRALDELATVRDELATVRDELATVRDELATGRDEFATRRDELATVRDELSEARMELAQLRPEVELWHSVRASRSYRITRVYIRAYSLPVVGLGLRLLRWPVGRLWRTIRRRR